MVGFIDTDSMGNDMTYYTNDVYNTSHADDAADTDATQCDSSLDLLRIVSQLYIALPISIVGVVLNILALCIFRDYKDKNSTIILLQCLALLDILVIVIYVTLKPVNTIIVCFIEESPRALDVWNVAFKILYPFQYITGMLETWLILLLTYDRWIAVCRPLRAARICTKAQTRKRITVTTVVVVVFSLPRFFESDLHGVFTVVHGVAPLDSYVSYVIVYKIFLFFTVMHVIPMVLLITLNTHLIHKLNISRQSLLPARQNSQVQALDQNRCLAKIVILVVIIFIVSNSSVMFSSLLWAVYVINKEQESSAMKTLRIGVIAISGVLVMINCGINFALYFFSSKRFRTMSNSKFCSLFRKCM